MFNQKLNKRRYTPIKRDNIEFVYTNMIFSHQRVIKTRMINKQPLHMHIIYIIFETI